MNDPCYLDFSIGGKPQGRVLLGLYDHITPNTCENFRSLCAGDKGLAKASGKPLHYKGSISHRVIPGFMIQLGDFTNFNGTGGESIYGAKFADENFKMKHNRPALLSMANGFSLSLSFLSSLSFFLIFSSYPSAL